MRLLFATALLLPALAVAQVPPDGLLSGARLQQRANAILGIMGFSVVPDVTSSFLSISDGQATNPALSMSQLAGGFTLSRDTPLYLEGGIAVSRYDPKFVVTDGVEAREIPLRWTSAIATLGVGWDIPIARDLVFRPIANASVGRMTSDAAIGGRLLEGLTGVEIEFLERGRLDAWGLGASLMLDYERYRPDGELDVELRYSYMYLRGYGATSGLLQGTSNVETLSLYGRWRAPTGWTLLQRPLRYVVELAVSDYIGDQRDVLGFTWLGSFGLGLELDTSAYVSWFSRVRLVGRVAFGDGVDGSSVGLAISF